MPIKDLEQAVGIQSAGTILDEIASTLGVVKELDSVSGGLVHYVFRVAADTQTAYLKIRGDHYSGIPEISTEPGLIANERKALELFSVNSARYFPRIISYNPNLHYLLLSDVMPGGTTLDKRYKQRRITQSDLYQLGRAIGSIHSENANLQEPVRDLGDSQYRGNLMKYALESYEHPVLMKASLEHRHRGTQLLVGDLSPKNTYVEGGMVGLCDLENAHQGALPYDQAFVLAHILLHHESRDEAIASMWTFFDGYANGGSYVDQGDRLIGDTLQGILLYRLDNAIIPYELPFEGNRRRQMVANVFLSLDQSANGLEAIASNLFRR